jgi:hypothetical protein
VGSDDDFGGVVVSLELQPITFKEACRYIEEHHRHHKPPHGYKFGIALNDGEKVVGVICVGRPIARHLDDGWTAGVTRCCTDGTKNSSSMLYGAAWRAARAMGYRRMITYTRTDESGVSMKAAGWTKLYETRPQSWNRLKRARVDKTEIFQRVLWEVSA